MRKFYAIFAACFILVGLVGVGISAEQQEAEAAVVYKYICFEQAGHGMWPNYAGGQSTNPRSAADACYRALGQRAGVQFGGYQCPYSGFSHLNYASGQYTVHSGSGFWDSLFCPYPQDSWIGTGTFYT